MSKWFVFKLSCVQTIVCLNNLVFLCLNCLLRLGVCIRWWWGDLCPGKNSANHCSSACLGSTTAVLFFCNPTLSLSVSAIFFYYFRLCSKHSRRHDHEQVITSEGWPRSWRRRRWCGGPPVMRCLATIVCVCCCVPAGQLGQPSTGRVSVPD